MDCEVFQGSSTVTVEHLTGEVKPVGKKIGDSIPGGARNLDGMMIVKVCLCIYFFFSSIAYRVDFSTAYKNPFDTVTSFHWSFFIVVFEPITAEVVSLGSLMVDKLK